MHQKGRSLRQARLVLVVERPRRSVAVEVGP